MKEHTPGPWSEGQAGNFRVYAPDNMGDVSGPVAEALAQSSTARRRANARLIAAAPDMLAALQLLAYGHATLTLIGCARDHCLAEASELEGYVEDARKIIAKATAVSVIPENAAAPSEGGLNHLPLASSPAGEWPSEEGEEILSDLLSSCRCTEIACGACKIASYINRLHRVLNKVTADHSFNNKL